MIIQANGLPKILAINSKNTQNVIENNTNEETEEVQEQEANQMVVEVSEPEEEPWQWQHDAPENHNIDVSVLNSVHNTYLIFLYQYHLNY